MLYTRNSRTMSAATAANGDEVRVWQCKCRLHVRRTVRERVVQCYRWRGINSADWSAYFVFFWHTRPQRDSLHPRSKASDRARSQEDHCSGHASTWWRYWWRAGREHYCP